MTLQGRVFRFLLTTFGWLPLGLNRSLGRGLGRLFRRLPNRTREVARRNIQQCFPDLPQADQEQLLADTMTQIGYGFLELPLFWRRSPDQTLKMISNIHGKELLDNAIKDGRGVLLAAPHLGAWELLCQYLSTRGACSFLYRKAKDPGISQVITDGRERLGAELVMAGASGVRRLFKAIKEGRIVGILPDQQPKGGQGEFVPFFGHQALTMVLYAKLAQRCDAPLVMAYAQRLPGGKTFDLHIVAGDPAIRDKNLEVSLAAMNAQIESLARNCPPQYQWGYKRFSIRPNDDPPFY